MAETTGKSLVYVNGRITPPERARVSALDRGFLFGDGIFETMRAYGGVVFRLEEHIERLRGSAALTGIALPGGGEGLEGVVGSVLRKSGLMEAYLRLSVTRGVGGPVPHPGEEAAPTVVVICRPLAPPPPSAYRNGVAAVISKSTRIPGVAFDRRVKSHSYQASVLARIEAAERGAYEALLADEAGRLVEGAMSNFFIVKSGVLATPPADRDILHGVTRAEIIRAARVAGIGVSEKKITKKALFSADECFLTTSLVEALPVTRVDGRAVGSGRPGPVTVRLAGLYRKAVREYVKARKRD